MNNSLKLKIDYFINVKIRQLPLFYKFYKKKMLEKPKVIGLIRERNEALLLQDTLDHLSQFVDAIVVYDDASTDRSVSIARNHDKVIEVIKAKRWRKTNRLWEEASNRKKLLSRAKKYNPEWFFYCDADERFEGDIKKYLLEECPRDVNSVRIPLLDAYITRNDKDPYKSGRKLFNFRKYFGPERRDILMIWRNGCGADFDQIDAREPKGIIDYKEETKFYCQHYGKSLSIEQWEETCNYYVEHFPKYRDKWQARKGKAIHDRSDFGDKLYPWDEAKLKSYRIN